MDDQTKSRLSELMFFVVPDPDEAITDEILDCSEAVDYEEGTRLKKEFRTLIETLDDHLDVRAKVLAAFDEIDASSNEALGNDIE